MVPLSKQQNEHGVHSRDAHQVGRTNADPDGSALIDTPHIAEALQYRTRKGDQADSSRIQRLGCVNDCHRGPLTDQRSRATILVASWCSPVALEPRPACSMVGYSEVAG